MVKDLKRIVLEAATAQRFSSTINYIEKFCISPHMTVFYRNFPV